MLEISGDTCMQIIMSTFDEIDNTCSSKNKTFSLSSWKRFKRYRKVEGLSVMCNQTVLRASRTHCIIPTTSLKKADRKST